MMTKAAEDRYISKPQKLFIMIKFTTTLLLSLLLISISSVAQSADEKEVASRVEALRNALITPDKTILEDLAAEELSYGHSSGLIENKTAFVNALVSGKTKFSSVVFSDQTITIAGNAAVVRHRMTADLNNNNGIIKIDIIILLVWQKQNGKWKILARQAAKKPA
jgi:hypothetical protein